MFFLQVVSEHVDHLVSSENFERTIANFDSNFSRLLLDMLDKILDMSSRNYDHKLSNIIYRRCPGMAASSPKPAPGLGTPARSQQAQSFSFLLHRITVISGGQHLGLSDLATS
nr:hypothetical protein BaRGS_004206 [Batillaria attramentaria]